MRHVYCFGALVSDNFHFTYVLPAADAGLCDAFWTGPDVSVQPLKALLASSAEYYPAIQRPLLRVLALTVASPTSAQAAFAFFQNQVKLVCAQTLGEPSIVWLGHAAGDRVVVRHKLPWSQAPRISGLALPEVRLDWAAVD